jgi:NADH:quinone reductase (non-electrogenic)
VWTAGQVIGLIHDIPTCAELVSRIEREAIESLSKTQSLIVPAGSEAAGEKGSVGRQTKNPSAEVYGIGKSKL